MKRAVLSLLFLAILSTLTSAQNIQVNRDNKTIYVTAQGEAHADAEIVTLTLGYHAWGKEKDALYDTTATVSQQVADALYRSGLKKELVRTGKVSLGHVDPEATWPVQWKTERLFEANLQWKVTVPVSSAESTVAVAIKAGASELESAEWDVVDRTKLQAEASRNALERARAVARSMSEGLQAKLGALVYASNSAPVRNLVWPFTTGELQTVEVSTERAGYTPVDSKVIKLLPEKIEEKTTVYAVFAIE
jgi:uncharacterized protein YggE